jgi:hypothetical protein
MHNETPQNTREAVELGLYLAITAETEEASKEALQLAKELALDLSPAEMEDAKANVRKFIADERLHSQMMEAAQRRSSRRVTRARIIDAIGCPNLYLTKNYNSDAPHGERREFFRFEYILGKMFPRGDAEVLGQLDVDQRNLKDLTLEQWVENGQMLVDQVEMRRDLSSVFEAASPSETPFQTKGREANLTDWQD